MDGNFVDCGYTGFLPLPETAANNQEVNSICQPIYFYTSKLIEHLIAADA